MREKVDSWEKTKRFEKIAILKEKIKRKKEGLENNNEAKENPFRKKWTAWRGKKEIEFEKIERKYKDLTLNQKTMTQCRTVTI